ncbi:MAG TPA: HEAT repeat domain-containing protein [Armatimonadota bacterium]|nr:HEAT repeat domain-containing protein [Armatimonadota bacterium]
MRQIHHLVVCAVYLLAASTLLARPAYAEATDTKAPPTRGIAVLASTIGSDFTPESLAEFVTQGKFSPVVVDWAWITYHWDKTDFSAVNKFLDLMAARKVPVAAMYRPRFLSNPTVPTQMNQDGERGVDHAEICYSDASARKWGISWGEKILDKCPSFREIIIYNPSNNCRCPKCTGASHAVVMTFLSEAKSAWRAKQPDVKLGVVHMPETDFWKAGLTVIDVAHPYLIIREGGDPAKNVADIKAVRSLVKEKMGSCLGKVTWEETGKISMEKLKTVDGLARENSIPYFVWTFDELFLSDKYDPKAVLQALGMDPAVGEALGKMHKQSASNSALAIEPNDAQRKSAEALLKQVDQAGPGAAKFNAIDAVARKAKESDPGTRAAIMSLALATMKNEAVDIPLRWPYCYVISHCRYEQGVPDLIELLLHDESEVMRGVAAEALADFNDYPTAHEALMQSARTETNSTVRDVLKRRLGSGIPAPGSVSQSSKADGLDETQRKTAEAVLSQIDQADYGQAKFDAIDAVVRKVRESDPATRAAVMSLALARIKDKGLNSDLRWPCCYVIARSGYEQGVPDVIEVLLHDESETMRSVAAEALGQLGNNTLAHDALMQSARSETSQRVRQTLARYLGKDMPDLKPDAVPPEPSSARGVEERAPSGPPKPPPGPAKPVAKPLPWPFPGDYKAQHLLNNYQTCTDDYIHVAIDLMQPTGTPVMAVAPGYVAAIYYSSDQMHDSFTITPEKGGDRGWGYCHMDRKTFTFKEGDFIEQGQVLGSLVRFSQSGKGEGSHLHLAYVTLGKGPAGRVDAHSVLDPLYFFDWKDTESPAFLPLRFVLDGTTQQFPADAAGVVTVKGKADILAAITDSACPGQRELLGVPVVMLSISDGTHTMQKVVLDHRGDIGYWKQVQPLYVPREVTRKLFSVEWSPYFQALRVTKTDGDGIIEPEDAKECWDTTALDNAGKPLWPNGQYSVNVYAWDLLGNQGVAGAIVQVKN